ncbi:MAG: S9 family peptidase [Vicinamibacterales bacterium]
MTAPILRSRHLVVRSGVALGAFLVALGVILVAVGTASAQPSPAPFTVEKMLELKRVSDPQLSPDGTRVAYVVTEVSLDRNARSSDLWVVGIEGGTPVRVTDDPASDDRPRWSPDGRSLAFISTRGGSSQVWRQPMDGARPSGPPSRLTAIATEATGVAWSPDGRWLAFLSDVFPACQTLDCQERELKAFESRPSKARVIDGLLFRHWTSWKDGRFSHLFVVPADGSSPPRDVTPGAADVPPFSLGGPEDYAFSPDSKEIAFARKTDPVEAISTNSDIFVVPVDGSAPPRSITPNKAADGGPVYSPDGRYIAYRAQSRPGFESDRWQLILYDRRTNEPRSLTERFDRHVDGFLWTADSKSLVMTSEDRGRSVIFTLAADGGLPRPLVEDGANGDVQISKDGRTMIFSRSTLRAPTEIFRANADGSGVTQLTHVNDAMLAPYALRAGESVTFKGAGGADVQAWIVKPNAFVEGQKYPLLYIVHGGPQSAFDDAWSFRWNAQVFASAGYVVMMPNPHGSIGWGQQFTDDISGDWGGRVFEDVMKGVDFAESLPYVDRTRTGAAGASYGGYMMNWLLGHTDRFKAIVTHAGVFNLTSMAMVTEEQWFTDWEFKGQPWTSPDQYTKWSPHLFVKNFKTPTLVTHGELDFRVPIGEGFQLFSTLQRLGVPSKMLYFPDEGHWIGKPANAQIWYRTFIDWMDRWVKGANGRTP